MIAARRAELEALVEKPSRQSQMACEDLEELTVAEQVMHRLSEQLHAEAEQATPARRRAEP